MAKLPDDTALGGLPSAASGRSIATYDGSAFGKGLSDFGAGLTKAGSSVADVVRFQDAAAQKEVAEKYSDAKNNAETEVINNLSEARHDADFSTLPDRAKTAHEAIVNKWAATVPDHMQETFRASLGPFVARANQTIDTHAFTLAGNEFRANVETNNEARIGQIVATDDPVIRATAMTNAADEYWKGIRQGYLTPQQARAGFHKFRQSYFNADTMAVYNTGDPDLIAKRIELLRTSGGAGDDSDPFSQPAGAMPAHWTPEVRKRAEGVSPDLMAVVKRAAEISDVPFVIGADGGVRDQATQDKLVAGGFSQTRNSNHLTGRASDLIPIIDGKPNPDADPKQFAAIAAAMKQAASELGVPLGWGGDWKSFKDYAHFELPRDYKSKDGNLKLASNAGVPDGISLPNSDAPGGAERHPFALVDPVQREQLIKHGEAVLNAVGIDQDREIRRIEAERKQKSLAAEDGILSNYFNNDKPVTAQTVVNHPELLPETKKQIINFLKLNPADRADTTYGPGFYSLFQRVHAPDGDPSRITDPTTLYDHVKPDGDLTVSGMEKLRAEIAGKQTPEGAAEGELKKQFLANAKSQITGSNEGLHLKDPKGDELYLKFMAQVLPAYDAARKEGKSASELFNPGSPSYIGKSIDGFKRPMDQWFGDMVSTPAANAPAAFDINSIKTVDQAVAAYTSGKLSKAQADQLAIERGWGARKAPAPTVPMSR
jgi:peptidoglycan L-alanyl-D-glutamate endopeptidase CwlK